MLCGQSRSGFEKRVDFSLQGLGVERGADFGVVVEVDVNVARDASGIGGAGAASLSAERSVAA